MCDWITSSSSSDSTVALCTSRGRSNKCKLMINGDHLKNVTVVYCIHTQNAKEQHIVTTRSSCLRDSSPQRMTYCSHRQYSPSQDPLGGSQNASMPTAARQQIAKTKHPTQKRAPLETRGYEHHPSVTEAVSLFTGSVTRPLVRIA